MTPCARTRHGTPISELCSAPSWRCNGAAYPQVDALCGFKVRGWTWVRMLESEVMRGENE